MNLFCDWREVVTLKPVGNARTDVRRETVEAKRLEGHKITVSTDTPASCEIPPKQLPEGAPQSLCERT